MILSASWLSDVFEQVRSMLDRNHLPQSLLIHGAPGTGRRGLASWIAARALGHADTPSHRARSDMPETAPEFAHPDFHEIAIPPEKSTIGVDQIRLLTAFLQLRSHQGGNRVAIIGSSESMTHAAFNSLLKTLEEPPPGATIILIAESTGRLPATVVSRCHRIRVPAPSREAALAWLRAVHPDGQWDELLDFASGSPFLALQMERRGFGPQAAAYAAELKDLRHGRAWPVELARRWAGEDPAVLLRWLHAQEARALTASLQPALDRAGQPLQKAAKALNMRSAFGRLAEIQALYRHHAKSINWELQLAALLERWGDERARTNRD
jgi:DNA polymerase-3 subunit delta'